MAGKLKLTLLTPTNFFIPSLILFASYSVVISDDTVPIPQARKLLTSWFKKNVQPMSNRKNTMDPALVAAESGAKTIRVRQDGKGDFKTITDAVNSVPIGNTKRVVIYIGPGTYKEHIKVDWRKPFITFFGNPREMPKIVYGATAAEFGTDDSATLAVESDYFVGANLVIVNSAPRPNWKKKGEQAVAFRIAGDKAALYNCKLYGFQDTLGDDLGRHLFKDCYIEGTIDFIFGDGRSLYLNTEIHVLSGDTVAVIAAQAGQSRADPGGFSFVHCKITGTGSFAYLGRAWMPFGEVVFSYSEMSDVIRPQGWLDYYDSHNERTVFFAEHQCTGVGADLSKRVGFTKKLSAAETKPYLNLGYIEASKWLLPPPTLNAIRVGSI